MPHACHRAERFSYTLGLIGFPCTRSMEPVAPRPSLKARLHEIIFEADTPAGKTFDLSLIAIIILSVVVVMLDSIDSVREEYGTALLVLEWIFTVLFTIEYALRIYSVAKPSRYIFSFFGIIDLLAILPTYLSLFLPGGQYFVVIRILRLLRIFRVFKLAKYLVEAQVLRYALRASRRKILVFLFTVIMVVVIAGSLMYVVEGNENGFTSIPRGIYWAIVTITTVGFGDITPATTLGQVLASVLMITGYAIIAVPTGIVSTEMSRAINKQDQISTQSCPSCSAEGHDFDAKHCKYCGTAL